jgi:hypothetical protein
MPALSWPNPCSPRTTIVSPIRPCFQKWTSLPSVSCPRGRGGPAADSGCFDVDDDFALFGGRDFRFDDFEVVRRVCKDGQVSLLHVGHGQVWVACAVGVTRLGVPSAVGVTKFWGRWRWRRRRRMSISTSTPDLEAGDRQRIRGLLWRQLPVKFSECRLGYFLHLINLESISLLYLSPALPPV